MARAQLADALGQAIDDAAVYVAIQSFASGVHSDLMVSRGEQFRGSHRAVQAHAIYFVPASVPEHEWPNPELL